MIAATDSENRFCFWSQSALGIFFPKRRLISDMRSWKRAGSGSSNSAWPDPSQSLSIPLKATWTFIAFNDSIHGVRPKSFGVRP